MSTWVRVVDSEEPDDDKPKEVWFATGASRKRKRSKKGKGSRNVTVDTLTRGWLCQYNTNNQRVKRYVAV